MISPNARENIFELGKKFLVYWRLGMLNKSSGGDQCEIRCGMPNSLHIDATMPEEKEDSILRKKWQRTIISDLFQLSLVLSRKLSIFWATNQMSLYGSSTFWAILKVVLNYLINGAIKVEVKYILKFNENTHLMFLWKTDRILHQLLHW